MAQRHSAPATIAGLVLVGMLPALLFGQSHTQSAPHWSYQGHSGPTHWGDLEADYSACKLGKHQSPIDIHDPQWTALPQLGFDYHPVPLRIINNGHTIQDLLPQHTGYYTFDGSLTTPPCTEGVRWLVLSDPTGISPSELTTFSKLYSDNARPTQPLNGRVVKESK